MNETTFTPVAEANATPAAAKLTDAELKELLASKPFPATITFGDEEEVTEDTANTLH